MKVIIGTDKVFGTSFMVLDRDLLIKLFEKNKKFFLEIAPLREIGLDYVIVPYRGYEFPEHRGGTIIADGILYVLDDSDKARSNPDLIKIFEEYGIENIEVSYAKKHLKIVEIPDDVSWYCWHPDVGPMKVVEKSRTWE